MKIEIRRNRDISFTVTGPPPDEIMHFLMQHQLSEEEIRQQQERYETWRRQMEDEFWRFIKEHPTRDCNGEVIKPETHEIGFDFGEPGDDGLTEVKTMWVRPKKSEYEK